MASNKTHERKGDEMTANETKQAWKSWQQVNSAEAAEIKDTFAMMTLNGSWEDAESYLCHIVAEKTGASFESVLDALG